MSADDLEAYQNSLKRARHLLKFYAVGYALTTLYFWVYKLRGGATEIHGAAIVRLILEILPFIFLALWLLFCFLLFVQVRRVSEKAGVGMWETGFYRVGTLLLALTGLSLLFVGIVLIKTAKRLEKGEVNEKVLRENTALEKRQRVQFVWSIVLLVFLFACITIMALPDLFRAREHARAKLASQAQT